ncbi:MAG: phage protein [Fusobacteriaceae bacterium]
MSKMYNQIRQLEIIYKETIIASPKGEQYNEVKQDMFLIDYTDLDINFDIKFTNDSNPNMCSIDVYNMSKEHRDLITTKAKVQLRAGYEDFHGYIFEGEINNVVHNLESSGDIITKLICTPSSLEWNKTFINKSWARYVTHEFVAKDICSEAGWTFSELKFSQEKRYAGGKIFRKRAKDALQEIASDNNLTLYFNNGVVSMYPKGYSPKKTIIVGPEEGLLDSPIASYKDDNTKIEKTKEQKDKEKMENKSLTPDQKKAKKAEEKRNKTQILTYNIKTALRYDYTEDTIIRVKNSKYVDEVDLKIVNGTHKASDGDFYTELECELFNAPSNSGTVTSRGDLLKESV